MPLLLPEPPQHFGVKRAVATQPGSIKKKMGGNYVIGPSFAISVRPKVDVVAATYSLQVRPKTPLFSWRVDLTVSKTRLDVVW